MKPKYLIALLVVVLLLPPLLWYLQAGARDSAPAVEIPLAADRLVDEIGINVHFSYPDTGYRYLSAARPAPNGSSVLRALRTLGVRHVRAGVSDTAGSDDRCAAFQTTAREGADFDLVTEIDDTRSPHVNTSQADLRNAVRCFGPFASHILAIEGPNERGSGDHCNGTEPPPAPSMAPYIGTFGTTPTSECIPEILGQQRVMWLARRAGVLPKTTQLWSSAFANTACEAEYDIAHYSDAYGKYLADYVDAVSSHAYLAFNEPEYRGGPGPYHGVPCSSTAHLNGGNSPATYDFINDTAYGTLKYYAEAARYSGTRLSGTAPPKPLVMTETGYEAACCGNSDTDVDVPTVTKYTLRELFATQAAGFGKEFIYELVSDTESLGLTDQYLNPKPVYYALENLIALLGDPGHSALTTRPFAVGVQAPSDVAHVVYQKHDGSNWLVVWQTDRSYDHATMTPLRVAPASATITLARRPAALTVYSFDPATGLVTPRSLLPARVFALPVSDTPEILQIGGAPVRRLARPLVPVIPAAVKRVQSVSCTTAGERVACALPAPLAQGALHGHVLVVTGIGNPSPGLAPSPGFVPDAGVRCGSNASVEVAHRKIGPRDPSTWTFTPAAGAADTRYTLDELENAALPLHARAGCIVPSGTAYPVFGDEIALPDGAGLEASVGLRMNGANCGAFDLHRDEFQQLQRIDAEICSRGGTGRASVFVAGSTFGGFAAGHRPTLELPSVSGVARGTHAAVTWWAAPTSGKTAAGRVFRSEHRGRGKA